MMTSNEIRERFLKFFRAQGHEIVPSSPLVPANDPTLLFTNAGMVQFKDVFLGRDKRSYTRATSSQRCVRAGGKHNDLENVGYTARHHTFFEMLGNFSFGDYFKEDAIRFAWDLLTGEFGLPADKLWVTVYEADDEAYAIWAEQIGVPKDRIVRIGDKKGGKRYESDNFWQMADTGPCGPCTEIFYDHGPEVAGGPPGSPDEDGDRYIEIWNLVFMQYDRAADGTMNPLPKPCVDTGMGLERVAAVLQGVHSNYEIDLFQALIAAAAKATGCEDLENNSLKVIADHIRACSFLIVDGVLPSNEGRGYVLRRIMRRAIRHGYKLGQEKPFFHTLVDALDAEMGEAYPELRKHKATIRKAIKQEEKRFAETLKDGMVLLKMELDPLWRYIRKKTVEIEGTFDGGELVAGGGDDFDAMQDAATEIFNDKEIIRLLIRRVSIPVEQDVLIARLRDEYEHVCSHRGNRAICRVVAALVSSEWSQPDKERIKLLVANELAHVAIEFVDEADIDRVPLGGKVAFKLYDTYGFPLDLTEDIGRERGITIDVAAYNAEMNKQRQRARAASKFGADYSHEIETDASTAFSGYEHLRDQGTVVGLFKDGKPVDELAAGEEGVVVLDSTPFYAESGGQVGDSGELASDAAVFAVADTLKRGSAHAHIGRLASGTLKVGDKVDARIDAARREAIVANHSATHLLHAALRKVLGEHVTQKGSLVAPDRLRFDFSHNQPVSAAELAEIEGLVNAEIRHNVAADVANMSYDDAIKSGAMALFGEKYGDTVRVMKFGHFSTELCGGTHVARTGDIGLFKIVSEGGVAAGIRRIEAVTGAGALKWVDETVQTLTDLAGLVRASRDDVGVRVKQLVERNRALEKDVEQLRAKLASGQGTDLASQAVAVGEAKVLAARLDGADAKALRDAVDQLKNKLGSAAVILGTIEDGKVRLVAGVTKDLTGKLPAGELVNSAAEMVGGRGGGRPDMAQAGGSEPEGLDAALEAARKFACARLG